MLVTQGAIIAALMGIVPAALAQELSHGAMGFEGKVLLKTTRTANNKPVALPSGGRAEITSMLVSIEPGGHSSLHSHPVPVIGGREIERSAACCVTVPAWRSLPL